MSEIPESRLRSASAELVRRAAAGEEFVITIDGVPAARLTPLVPSRRRWLTSDESFDRLTTAAADPGLRADLAWISGEQTDERGI